MFVLFTYFNKQCYEVMHKISHFLTCLIRFVWHRAVTCLKLSKAESQMSNEMYNN